MLFHSTYAENLKKKKVKVELGYVNLEDYESPTLGSFKGIVNHAEKLGIDEKEIKFYKDRYDSGYGESFDRLCFYFERDETDKEFEERLEKFQVQDLKDSIQEVTRFYGCVRQKEELKKLYLKLVVRGKYQGLIDKTFNEFVFGTETEQEKIQKAYEKGLAEGKKKLEEFQKKLKEIGD
jgi:hypothetical protein